MASLSLKHIYKVYDGGVKAVNDFCMEIEDKEFIVFVGPSGCGKSTTLRMIAGLEEITAGELMIGDEVVNDVEPKDRNIAMVFQNYALYPHMTVRENMAFALKLRKEFSAEEIEQRVNEAAKTLDIEQYLDRKPRALSGGQRQRVSLGRAIVRDPKVFLLDEPLSNLDAKLRAQMRTEITKLHKKLATTFIYVTHDQVEAMTMGTRIVVMKLGVVQQIDTPQNLYRYPGNKFVAGFIGTPQMNFYEATLSREGDKVRISFAGEKSILVPAETVIKAETKYFDGKTPVVLGVRPEDIHYEKEFIDAHPDTTLTCHTGIVEALGSESIVYSELDEANVDSISESQTRMVFKIDPRVTVKTDEVISVAIDPERIHLFDKETENTIMPRVPRANLLPCTVADGVMTVMGKNIKLPSAISIANGDYTVNVPTDSIIFEGVERDEEEVESRKTLYTTLTIEKEKFKAKGFKNVIPNYPVDDFAVPAMQKEEGIVAKVAEDESIGNINLARLNVGGATLFAIAPKAFDTTCDSLEISLDFKKISFVKANEEGVEEVVFDKLETTNVLSAKMVKERVYGKEYNFALALCDKELYTTEYVRAKLFNAAGRKVFDITLDVDFDIYNVKIAEEGFKATVSDILDYGREKIAVCAVGDKKVNVYLRNDSLVDYTDENGEIAFRKIEVGDQVSLSINLPCAGIVEADRGIRII